MAFLSRLFPKLFSSGAQENTGGPPVEPDPARMASQPPSPIDVDSISEEYAYLALHPCESCGHSWKVVFQALESAGSDRRFKIDRLSVECSGCVAQGIFRFRIDSESPAYTSELEAKLKDLLGDDD